MRVVVTGFDSRGGVEPLAALAVRLREQGADVTVCLPPDKEFQRRLAGMGVAMAPFGQEVRPAATRQGPPDLPRRAAEVIANQHEVLLKAADGADAVVASGVMPACAGARTVAEKLGLRYVYATFQQLTLPSPYHPPIAYVGRPFPAGADIPAMWDWDRDSINLLFGAAVNNDRARLGLPEVDDVRDYVITDRPLLAANPVLSPWREAELQVVQTGAWLLPDERPLPADLARFLDGGEPPVYVGFGSMPMHQATDLGEVVVEAVRRHGRRMVLSRGWADLESAGDDCFVTGEANHQALFRRSAAVVHHGGAGTTVTAAWAGTPQVVVPQGADQPHWASRVAELGIGAAHDGPAPTVESLAEALGTALASKKRAAAVAATIPTDGAATAAKIVLG
ncbi:glycosyltransferase [Kutzneria sp. NPDC051319]|uniref:glycosyltransferase n=1 Tax=Kutzneria sp. NPDC051319 TaxID=3155047 RepID=UPI0034230D14